MRISFLRTACRGSACALAIAVTAVLPMYSPSALGADLAPQPRAIAVPTWTGFYIGVHGGGAWNHTEIEDSSLMLTYNRIKFNSSGALAGAQLGADWQFGNFVVGGEIDAAWASISGRSPVDPRLALDSYSSNIRALVTGAGRVGYAAGSYLAYAKAGVAWADIDFKYAIDTPFTQTIDHSRTGTLVGTGLEMMLMSNLSAKVEYDFIYLGATAMNIGSRRGSQDVEHSLHLVKAGLNWRFNSDYLLARR